MFLRVVTNAGCYDGGDSFSVSMKTENSFHGDYQLLSEDSFVELGKCLV
jgi:hypothetical protein